MFLLFSDEAYDFFLNSSPNLYVPSLMSSCFFALALKRNLLFAEHFLIQFFFAFPASRHLNAVPSLYLTCSRYPDSLICSDLVGSAYIHFKPHTFTWTAASIPGCV
jgi:hypothetical protein